MNEQDQTIEIINNIVVVVTVNDSAPHLTIKATDTIGYDEQKIILFLEEVRALLEKLPELLSMLENKQ